MWEGPEAENNMDLLKDLKDQFISSVWVFEDQEKSNKKEK